MPGRDHRLSTPTTTGSCSAARCPPANRCALPTFDELRAEYFLENREVGIVNVGGTGTVTADGEIYTLPNGACLYLGRGTRDVVFADDGRPGHRGAQFYLFSAPAHTTYPTQLVLPGEGNASRAGRPADQQSAHPEPVHPRRTASAPARS